MNTLEKICSDKREHIAKRKAAIPEQALLKAAKDVSPPRGFARALKAKTTSGAFALIAEIKKASPSGGLIRADFNPASLAKAYENGSAACLSVLTDEPHFQGRDEYLAQARNAASLPVLRKDFMLDSYQIAESRALGADCVLLIMAALSNSQAQELARSAYELGMDVLVEVHDEDEMDRALTHLKPKLLGINNRNLKTLKTDLATSENLAKKIPASILGICESGIRAHADLLRMQKAGLNCFLVGESLMKKADVAAATKELLYGSSH